MLLKHMQFDENLSFRGKWFHLMRMSFISRWNLLNLIDFSVFILTQRLHVDCWLLFELTIARCFDPGTRRELFHLSYAHHCQLIRDYGQCALIAVVWRERGRRNPAFVSRISSHHLKSHHASGRAKFSTHFATAQTDLFLRSLAWIHQKHLTAKISCVQGYSAYFWLIIRQLADGNCRRAASCSCFGERLFFFSNSLLMYY